MEATIKVSEFIPEDEGIVQASDEQLIRARREVKFLMGQFEQNCGALEEEIKSRIRAQGPLVTPSGTASISTRHDKYYDSRKVYGVLGMGYFLRVVRVSSTLLKALFETEGTLDFNSLDGCYKTKPVEILNVR